MTTEFGTLRYVCVVDNNTPSSKIMVFFLPARHGSSWKQRPDHPRNIRTHCLASIGRHVFVSRLCGCLRRVFIPHHLFLDARATACIKREPAYLAWLDEKTMTHSTSIFLNNVCIRRSLR